MNEVIEWIRENGRITYEDWGLVCARVGNAKIRVFPVGSEVHDETPWVAVRGPDTKGKLSPAYYNFEDFKQAVEAINEQEVT